MSLRILFLGALLGACLLLFTPSTQAAETKGKWTARTYPVAQILGYMALTESPAQADKTGKDEKRAEEKLIDLVVATVQPESWKQAGGRGKISYEPASRSLVIHQTITAHDEIADLLAALARLMDLQVALEIRLLTISEVCLERVGVNFEPAGTTNESTTIPSQIGKAFLNDSQVREFLEAAQGDRRTNIMQAPNLMMLNGQTGVVEVADTQYFVTSLNFDSRGGQVIATPTQEPFKLGICMTAQPTVSADRKSVLVKLNFKSMNLAGPVPLIPVQIPIKKLDKTGNVNATPELCTFFLQQPQVNTLTIENSTVIPEGQTLLLGGIKMLAEERNEFGPPVLSKIPYLNRFFRTVGYGRESVSLVILVTPRVIVKDTEPSTRTENRGDEIAPPAATEPSSKKTTSQSGERTQVRFVQPSLMKVAWYTQDPEGRTSCSETPISVPGRYNFLQGSIYRLRLSNIKSRPGLEVYPSLEVVPFNYKTEAFLAHSSVPVTFTDEEFEQIIAGKNVVKVIYLPDPEYQELSGSGAEEISSIRLEPGADPIQEAQRRGSILLVIRTGDLDPSSSFLDLSGSFSSFRRSKENSPQKR